MLSTLLYGFVAGLIATVPMTLFMAGLFALLPRREQYPLPPHEITGELAKKADVDMKVTESQHWVITTLAHFAFGGSAGAVYGLLRFDTWEAPLMTGILFGLCVWSVSYLIGLPLFNILRPATKHPARRNLLMIGAHLVWGSALAYAFRQFMA